MPHRWPEDTDFALWELDVIDRQCPACGRMMHVCDHRYRRFFTLDGPVPLVCKLDRCPDPRCPGHAATKSPEAEPTIALPRWAIGWDVFCWVGHPPFPPRPPPTPAAPPATPPAAPPPPPPRPAGAPPRRPPPPLPGHARGAAPGPRGVAPPLPRGRSADPLDRRPAAGEGARGPVRRPR